MSETLQTKMILAGVGGQGTVYITNLLVEAAMQAGLPVATSEIHGLSQRGGSVNAALTLGAHTFGFVEEGGADFLLGFETLEAQRCLPFLNSASTAIIDSTKIYPYSVNADKARYPDTGAFLEYLQKHIKKVVYVSEDLPGLEPVLRNIFVLGKAASIDYFPIKPEYIEKAILETAKSGYAEKTLKVFHAALHHNKENEKTTQKAGA